MSASPPTPDVGLRRSEPTLWAIRRHMQCSKQPVNLGAFGQVLGSLTDYNLASADEDDLSVLRSIAPSHHCYIVEINPNGLCFEIGALHPRCHCRSLSLPGLILLQSKLPLRLPARAARQLPDQSTTLWVESSSTCDSRLRGALPGATRLSDASARSRGRLRRGIQVPSRSRA
jgi:hypothetical protein